MADKRQVYRVILQLMTYIAIGLFLWLMFRSAFVSPIDQEQHKLPEIINFSLQQLAVGEISRVIWEGKSISILHRNRALKNTDPSSRYFVFYNRGDSGYCPLFFNGKVLKDTCTGTQYNQKGEPINTNKDGDLASPPYYFSSPQLLHIGTLEKEKK
ncbi:MAG: hypothetical protein KAG28_00250 [Cocleimonas sp.]|nr:hypothetical protein [Cocleimonas sp.]